MVAGSGGMAVFLVWASDGVEAAMAVAAPPTMTPRREREKSLFFDVSSATRWLSLGW
ncbi:hypothetical protein SUS17_1137 [Sphingomonas sp. S17]|nr:hypothetical protein SUS17_1137 [Sphingomonas sp. S17]